MNKAKHITCSIVIPTFNRADLLRKAIDSSLAQTVPCEVIVCSHGSTDNTDEVAESYGSRIKYISRSHDFGPHFCWLEGVLHASSPFIHLQYDDDWIEPTYIEKCLGLFRDDVGFVFSIAKQIDIERQEEQGQNFKKWLPSTGVFPIRMIEKRVLKSLISPAAAIFRKDVLVDSLYQGKLPLSKTHYHGVGPDCFVTLLSMLRFEYFGYVKEPLAVFGVHGGSITVNSQTDQEKARKLANAYGEVKSYYKKLKLIKKLQKIW
jgi:glycosyltransferase involved in cell wall biosynthesis